MKAVTTVPLVGPPLPSLDCFWLFAVVLHTRPPILVFLETIVFLSHYKTLRGMDYLILMRTSRLRELPALWLPSNCPKWHLIDAAMSSKQCFLFVEGVSTPYLGLMDLEKEEIPSGSCCGRPSSNALQLNTFLMSGVTVVRMLGGLGAAPTLESWFLLYFGIATYPCV